MNSTPNFDETENRGYVHIDGLELQDGTYLKNYSTELRYTPTGRTFIFGVTYHDRNVQVHSWGEYDMIVELSKETIQEMYTDGVLEIVE